MNDVKTVWQLVENWSESNRHHTPVTFVQECGPCSAKHVAARLGWTVDYVTRKLRKAERDGLLNKELRYETIDNQMRRVAFYSEVK